MGITTTILKCICFASVCFICAYAFLNNKRTNTIITKMVSNEELKSRMDRIIDWVKTCDTKASIMLTLVCLVLSFLFTSDFILGGFSKIIQSIRLYKDADGACSFKDISYSGTLTVISFSCYIYFTLGSIYRLILVLYSKINESQIEDGLKKRVYKVANFLFYYVPSAKNTEDAYIKSLIHFHNIAEYNTFDDFNQVMANSDSSEQDDLLSQIYINANRCKEKFNDYNAAVRWMLYSVPFLIPLFISISIFMTYRN